METDDDTIKFSSGREEYTNRLIIGISPNEPDEVFYGYDGSFDAGGLTQDERRELADFMIDLWTKFKK